MHRILFLVNCASFLFIFLIFVLPLVISVFGILDWPLKILGGDNKNLGTPFWVFSRGCKASGHYFFEKWVAISAGEFISDFLLYMYIVRFVHMLFLKETRDTLHWREIPCVDAKMHLLGFFFNWVCSACRCSYSRSCSLSRSCGKCTSEHILHFIASLFLNSYLMYLIITGV